MPLTTTQKLRWGLYGATLLAGLVVAIGFLNTSELTRRSAWVRQSAAIVTELEVLQAQLTDAETGQRGFLLTRDPAYLEPYDRATPVVEQHLATLAGLLAADPAQRAALDSLGPLIRTKLTELQRTIALDSTEGLQAARALVVSGQGKAVMDSIRSVVGHMRTREQANLVARTQEHRRTAALSEVVLLAVLALVGALCLMGRRVVDRDDRQRTAATAEILRLRDLAEEEAARSEEETARAEDEAARARRRPCCNSRSGPRCRPAAMASSTRRSVARSGAARLSGSKPCCPVPRAGSRRTSTPRATTSRSSSRTSPSGSRPRAGRARVTSGCGWRSRPAASGSGSGTWSADG